MGLGEDVWESGVAFLESGQAVDGSSQKFGCLASQYGRRTPQFGGRVTTWVRQSGIQAKQSWSQGLAGSLSGKNLANNGHSSNKCACLAEPPEASAAGNFFWRVLARRRATLREISAVF